MMKKSTIILMTFVIVLAVGHLEWLNYSRDCKRQLEQLEGERLELEILLENCEESRIKQETIIQEQQQELSTLADVITNTQHEILQYEYCGEYIVTAYCCEKYPHICGGGKTASGTEPIPDLTCATCDLQKFPYGTIIYIEGIGIRVVQDTGGFDKTKMDVAVKTHEQASHWKNAKHKVWIVREK